MSEEASALFLCPGCGAFVSEDSDKCPNCGAALDESEDDVELELDELIDEGKDKCPKCGAEMPSDGSPCKKCATAKEDSLPDASTEISDKGTEIIDAEQDEDDEKGVALYLCSECGAFTAETEKECSNCGALLDQDSEDLAPETDVPQSPTSEKDDEDNIYSMLELVEKEPEEVTAEEPPKKEISEEDDEILDKLKHIEEPGDVESLIESFTDDDDDISLDDLELEPGPGKEKPEKEDQDIIPDDLESSEAVDFVEEELAPVETVLKGDIDIKSSEVSDEELAICAECGAFVSPDQKKCGVCDGILDEDSIIFPTKSVSIVKEERGESFAQRALKKLFGVADDAELKPVEEIQMGGELAICTVCGAFLSEHSAKCGICGTVVEDMPEFKPPTLQKQKDDMSLAICPNCSAFVSASATSCNLCGKDFKEGMTLESISQSEVLNMADETADAEDLLKRALGVIDLKDTPAEEPTTPTGMIDLCPDCGAFVSPNATSCAICGSSLIEDIGDIAGDIVDLESTIEELASIECPNCDSKIAVGSTECPLCGLVFDSEGMVADEFRPKDDGEDLADFLDFELTETIHDLEDEAEELEVIEELAEDLSHLKMGSRDIEEPEETDTFDLEHDEDVPFPEVDEHVTETAEPETVDVKEEIVKPKLRPMRKEAFEAKQAAPLAVKKPVETESLVWEEDVFSEISESEADILEAKPEVGVDEELEMIDDHFVDEPAGRFETEPDLDFEVPKRKEVVEHLDVRDRVPVRKQASWEYGVYASIATVALFIVYYIIAPGDYSTYLGLIFGIILLMGVYMLFTDKGTFSKGDLKRSTTFSIGCFIVAFIVLHWMANVWDNGSGLLAQPSLDRMMFSMSILFIGVGIIWMRSRVRYVMTWFNGTILLFISTVAYIQFGSGANVNAVSASLLVGGTGASLVFVSLVFLTYERAIRSSIESDLVRGDVEYLRQDFSGALASYQSAMNKTDVKRRKDTVGPPMNYDMPWYSKGSALILMGRLEEGIENLEMALAINSNNEVTWVNKGNAHSRLGQQEKALECYESAIKVNPNYEIAWNNMGNVLAREGLHLDALKCYNTAIKINPDYDDVWVNKGYVLVKMGRHDQALKCINRVQGESLPNGTRPTRAV